MAQITSITSESLQSKVRDLLPSQQGFGEDLQAQNVIVPVIDLTAAAQGTDVPLYQQQAFAFDDINVFNATNATVVIANTPGFWRIYGQGSIQGTSAVLTSISIQMSDGISTKNLYQSQMRVGSNDLCTVTDIFDFVVFLSAGDSISAISTNTATKLAGVARQVADTNGNPINPSGFTPQ